MTREQKLLGVAIAMVVFVVSLLMDWVSFDTPLGSTGAAGTEANSWWIGLAFAAVAGLIAAAEALSYPAPFRWASVGLAALTAVMALTWALVHFLDATEGPATPGIGAWIGLIASAVGAVLAGYVWDRERV